MLQNGLINPGEAAKKLQELRAITPPKGLEVYVGGTPALEQDSIHSLFDNMPAMLVILLTATTLLMFLAFGSVVLPIKAAVMSALTLGSTMGILTWIFVDGHGSGLLNFTATPLTAPVIALVVAVGYGLATDYEVFLVSRMVEARESGMSTQEAIRIGTATTGRLITAAALVLAVVAGSFVFSDLVMMKYLAFGLMAALLLDATVVRMFLVPSVMKLLGDDCWWAPRWMRRVQTRIGLGEIQLPDERKRPVTDGRAARPPVTAGLVAAGPRPRTIPPTRRRQSRPNAGLPGRRSGLLRAGRPVRAPSRSRSRRASRANRRQLGCRHPANRAHRAADRAAPRRRHRRRPGHRRRPAAGPSAGQTRAMPIPGSRSVETDSADATAKLPVQRPEDSDSDAATEQLNARGAQGDNGARRRRGAGGLSAQDLLRREGRL
ncbi:MMPL family protein [Mycobacterium kansasii]|uniref:MMPL family protein n=1 Tax=Mycobacterium kansasii TaxID=1768 RepID=A0A1V3WP84_MYCKA|nr:MMPL family protein [Mycobacterium kansasii]